MEGTEALDRVRSSLLELDRALKGTDLEQQAAQAVGALDQFQAGYYDFREICDNLYDGIHITDGEGKVLFINQAYTRTTGIRRRRSWAGRSPISRPKASFTGALSPNRSSSAGNGSTPWPSSSSWIRKCWSRGTPFLTVRATSNWW